MVADVIKLLDQNLTQQTALYQQIVELEQHKKKAIIENALQELERITAREEQLLIDVNRLEKERQLWAERIGQQFGKAPEEITLGELVNAYPTLAVTQEKLEKVITELQELHRINTDLLKQAMKVLDFTIGLMTHEEKTTYSQPGKESQGNRGLSFLDKSI